MKVRVLNLLFVGLLFSFQSYSQDEFKLDKTFSIAKSGTLYLDSDDAEVKIKGTDRSDVKVYIYRSIKSTGLKMGDSDFSYDVDDRDGNLRLREVNRSNRGYIGYVKETYEIEIELPKSVNLEIRGDDDNYEIDNMTGKISMKVDDANSRLRNCSGNYFDFDIEDGDLSLRGNPTGVLYLRTDDGDITIDNGSFSEINARLDDGDLDIRTSLAQEGKYDIRSEDGTVYFTVLGGGGKFDIRHDDGRVDISSQFQVSREDEHRTVATIENGGSTIHIGTDDGKVVLESGLSN